MRFTQRMEGEVLAALKTHPRACVTFDPELYRPDGNILITRNHMQVFLHRYLYTKVIGPVERGKFLLQVCKTPGCMNPNPGHRAVYDRPRWRTSTTSCPKGHEYVEGNVRIDGRGYRECVTCAEASYRRFRPLKGTPDAVAINRAKTHCPEGHEYTEENTYTYVDKATGGVHRKCKICTKARAAEQAKRIREEKEMSAAADTVKHA